MAHWYGVAVSAVTSPKHRDQLRRVCTPVAADACADGGDADAGETTTTVPVSSAITTPVANRR